MNPYDAGYSFIQTLVGMVRALWPLAGPFIIMGVIIKVFGWTSKLSRRQARDDE
jgi:hypothetical protein